jgi:hypothetical protein
MPSAYNVQEGFQYVQLVNSALPIFTFYKPQALSAVESAGPGTMGFNPSGSGAYYSGSGFVHTGSIYYAADLQRYRILRDKVVGWEDLVPSASSAVAANLQAVTTAGNQTSESVNITGSLTNGSAVAASNFLQSHAEGNSTTTFGFYSHTEGLQTTTTGNYSHAEGLSTTAVGDASHAEGSFTRTTGVAAHAEGSSTVAFGDYSHAEGFNTTAIAKYQHVQGLSNIPLGGEGTFIIGNGTVATPSNLVYASGSQVQVTGSLNTTEGIYITPTWRIIPSASNLVVEKFNGSAWTQSGIFS